MRHLILIAAAGVLAVWSLLAWGAYHLLGFATGLAASNSEFLPIEPELVVWIAELLGGMGGIAVWIVWGFGAAVIAILAVIALALLRRRLEAGPLAGDMAPGRSDGPAGGAAAAGGELRSGDEIVARVLGRTPGPTRQS